MWLDIKNVQLCRALGLEFVKEISRIRYNIENYDNKVKCKAEDRSCGKINKHLIVSPEKYNI